MTAPVIFQCHWVQIFKYGKQNLKKQSLEFNFYSGGRYSSQKSMPLVWSLNGFFFIYNLKQ